MTHHGPPCGGGPWQQAPMLSMESTASGYPARPRSTTPTAESPSWRSLGDAADAVVRDLADRLRVAR